MFVVRFLAVGRFQGWPLAFGGVGGHWEAGDTRGYPIRERYFLPWSGWADTRDPRGEDTKWGADCNGEGSGIVLLMKGAKFQYF